MKKMVKWYLLWAVILVLFTGLLSLCIGMSGFIPNKTGKNIIEVLSSLLGSICLAFFLGWWKEKEWENRRTTAEIRLNCIFGIVLFACRMISRLVFYMFPDMIKGIGYVTCIFIDLICIILLYSQIPDEYYKKSKWFSEQKLPLKEILKIEQYF